MATETEIPLHAIALWMENNGCKQGHRKEVPCEMLYSGGCIIQEYTRNWEEKHLSS